MFSPVFPAVMMAIMKSNMNLMMGIPHVPKPRKPIEEGRAFKETATNHLRSDMVIAMEEERDAGPG